MASVMDVMDETAVIEAETKVHEESPKESKKPQNQDSKPETPLPNGSKSEDVVLRVNGETPEDSGGEECEPSPVGNTHSNGEVDGDNNNTHTDDKTINNQNTDEISSQNSNSASCDKTSDVEEEKAEKMEVDNPETVENSGSEKDVDSEGDSSVKDGDVKGVDPDKELDPEKSDCKCPDEQVSASEENELNTKSNEVKIKEDDIEEIVKSEDDKDDNVDDSKSGKTQGSEDNKTEESSDNSKEIKLEKDSIESEESKKEIKLEKDSIESEECKKESKTKEKSADKDKDKENCSNDDDLQTIVVTEARSLAQVINKAVGNESEQNVNKPTLVIIDTAAAKKPTKPADVPTLSAALQRPQVVTETKTVAEVIKPKTAVVAGHLVGQMPTTAVKSPYPQSTNAAQPSNLQDVLTLLPADGGILLEAPSLVVPYVVERTAKEDLVSRVKELKEAIDSGKPAEESPTVTKPTDIALQKAKAGLAQNLTERWNSYFAGPVGKFLSDIGMNQVSEWIHHDIARSTNKKNVAQAEKLSKVLKSLEHIKERNQAFHFKLRKCRFCNFKTESDMVIEHHLQEPHTWNGFYKCNFCKYDSKSMYEVLNHMLLVHKIPGRAVPPVLIHQCSLCLFEDTSKGKLTKHSFKCQKNFQTLKNQAPPPEFDPPAKRIRIQIVPPPRTVQPNFAAQIAAQRARMRLPGATMMNVRGVAAQRVRYPNIQPSAMQSQMYGATFQAARLAGQQSLILPGMTQNPIMVNQFGGSGQFLYPVMGSVRPVMSAYQNQVRGSPGINVGGPTPVALIQSGGGAKPFVLTSVSSPQSSNSSIPSALQQLSKKSSISITPVTKPAASPSATQNKGTPNAANKNSNFVICEICDGYIKDLEALRNHMQWIHKVKIHPRMIYNRPPLNCQKCQCRFFTDQGLERHLLGTHGLVTSSMQESANKGRDGGRCTNCGKVFQWKLLAHMSKDHSMTLKPAHLSYKCTVCSATFGMYRLFEEHVYTAHSNVAKKMLEGPEKKKAPAAASPAASTTPKSTPAVTITARPTSISVTKTTSSSKSGDTSSSSQLTISKVTDLKCLECGKIFERPADYFQHWESVHLKSCEVKTCKVDKCKDCLEKFKLGEDVVCTHLTADGSSGDAAGSNNASDKEESAEENSEDEGRKRKSEGGKRKPCPRSKRLKVGGEEAPKVSEQGKSKSQQGKKESGDENGSDAFDMEVESHEVESPGQIGVASDED